MMNTELHTKFFFGNAATLAGIVISMPCVSALLAPVGSIRSYSTAAPVTGVFANKIFALPFGLTFNSAKSPPSFFDFAVLGYKWFTALFADLLHFGISWVVLANLVFGIPFTETELRAKNSTGAIRFFNRISAILTVSRLNRNDMEFPTNIGGSGASLRAMNARIAFVKRKLYSAGWAYLCIMRGKALAFTRAILFVFDRINSRIERKIFSTMRARGNALFLLHPLITFVNIITHGGVK
jgi:hypothetical protein